jgi:N-acetylmuramoyl-L-alanine amidase
VVHKEPSAPVAILIDKPHPEPKVPATWADLQKWCAADNKTFEKVRANGGDVYRVHAGTSVLIFQAKSQIVRWNGTEVRLGFPVQIVNGSPTLNYLDLAKTIEPLISQKPFANPGNSLIVIDPGHGGADAGARGTSGFAWEKELTLDWARRVAGVLSGRGFDVFLTRTNDMDVGLSNRVSFADSRNAALFVSLHFNSAGANGGEAGIETYCLTPKGLPSTVTRGFYDDWSAVFPNNEFDSANLQLAASIHRHLVQASGVRDRGIRRARFLTVLRGQQRPAVLIEGGYLSNSAEARLLEQPAYRQKLAVAVVNALTENLPVPIKSTQISQALKSGPEAKNTSSPTVSGSQDLVNSKHVLEIQ